VNVHKAAGYVTSSGGAPSTSDVTLGLATLSTVRELFTPGWSDGLSDSPLWLYEQDGRVGPSVNSGHSARWNADAGKDREWSNGRSVSG